MNFKMQLGTMILNSSEIIFESRWRQKRAPHFLLLSTPLLISDVAKRVGQIAMPPLIAG